MGADATFGKRQDSAVAKTANDSTTLAKQKEMMCDKCLNKEMLQAKHQHDETLKQRDREAYQRTAEKLRDFGEQEKLRRVQQATQLKQEALTAQVEAAKRRQKVVDPSEREMYERASEEAEKARKAENERKTEETRQYNKELQRQMDAHKQAAKDSKDHDKEAERSQKGLDLDYYKGDKYQAHRQQHKQVLEQQLAEEQMRRSKDPGADEAERTAQSKVQEMAANLAKQKEEEERKRKAEVKGDYLAHLQSREAQAAQDRERKIKEQEAHLEQIQALRSETAMQKKQEQDRKKELGSFLANQIQEKEAKRQAAKSPGPPASEEAEVLENAGRRPDSSKPETRAVKQENLRLMQERAADKAHDRVQQVQAEQDRLKQLQEQENERRLQEQRKREEQRRDMEEARRQTEAKRANQQAAKEDNKADLAYYEALNSQLRLKIQEERDQNKAKEKDYKAGLESQIASKEEAKKRLRQDEQEQERAAKGLALDSYQRDPASDKRQYQRDLAQQYKDTLAQKAGKRPESNEAEELSRVDQLAEQLRNSQAAEEQKKKQEQKEDYQRSLASRDRQRQEAEQQKALERDRHLAEGQKLRSAVEEEKRKDKEKQKRLNEDLATQLEADKTKKEKEKATRCDWMDERAKKHAEELERKVSQLKEEILRCIKCNAALDKKKLQGKMAKPLT